MINKLIRRINNLSIKQQLIRIILIILITDVFIIFDIPILRQVFGFLTFTLIPGFLIVATMRLDKLGFAEKFVLSIGLGVAFLMFTGLIINETYYALGYKTPLSTYSLMISFSIIMVLMIFLVMYQAYKRNDNQNFLIPTIDLKTETEKILFIAPLIFPILSVLGTYLMNTRDNNSALLLLYILILAYVALVAFLRNSISNKVYVIAIIMMSISLIFVTSLRSDYLIGVDVHGESYIAENIANLEHWSLVKNFYLAPYSACLSVGMLPPIYSNLLGVSSTQVGKFFYTFIFSIVPLCIYLIVRTTSIKKFAFFSAFLYMSQAFFTGNWIAFTSMYPFRTGIAITFAALAFFILFSNISKTKRILLFIIFIFSCVVSHYSTSFFLLIALSSAFFIIFVINKFNKSPTHKDITFGIIVLLFAFIFLWYAQLTETQFDNIVRFIEKNLSTLKDLFIIETHSLTSQQTLKATFIQKGIPYAISYVIQMLNFIFIGIGVLSLTYTFIIKKKISFNKTYFSLSFAFFTILFMILVVPFLGYDYGRSLALGLIILAPLFFIGGEFLFKFFNSNIRNSVIMIILLMQFICTSDLIFVVFNVPHSIYLNNKGIVYDDLYIHTSEIAAIEWITNIHNPKESIGTDYLCRIRFFTERSINKDQSFPNVDHLFFSINKTKENQYIFLRYQNVVKEELSARSWEDRHKLQEYSHLFINKNKIYSNADCEIYQ